MRNPDSRKNTTTASRWICGWVCPMNTLLEVVDKLRRVLKLVEIKNRDVRFSLGADDLGSSGFLRPSSL